MQRHNPSIDKQTNTCIVTQKEALQDTKSKYDTHSKHGGKSLRPQNNLMWKHQILKWPLKTKQKYSNNRRQNL